ncbi:sensor histidine kinase [Peredibacter sp. HCB2-198]|uniref:sensor histidine kinase n=1 Tax=Peredibacter sp. HCB2-198 TaxID=3383025 RepID=UPI0038B55D1D
MKWRNPLQYIKFDYLIAAFLTLIVCLFIYGRQRLFHEMDVNHSESVEDMEEHFQRISSGQHLRNLSHLINIHSVNYLLRKDPKDKQILDETNAQFHQVLRQLETPEDHPLLDEIARTQDAKLAYFNSMLPLTFDQKVEELQRPKIRSLNAKLRNDEDELIELERNRYLEESRDVDDARKKMVKELTFNSTLLLFLTIGISALIIFFANRFRLQSQKRLQAIKSRDDILSVVSHDLKNPLGTIKLNSQMALRNLTSNSPSTEKIVRNLDGIQKAVDVMQSLILDLLDMRKLEEGKFELELREENLNDLVLEAETLLKPIADTKSITIANVLPPSPVIVKCDKKRMLQILSNLLSNALKFTKEGGKVEVRAEDQGEQIHLAVVDNGSGIPAKDLPHIFDRYWQAKATAKQGTGLGLSIVKGLVSAHGGYIWVESKVNRGSAFHFTLPV